MVKTIGNKEVTKKISTDSFIELPEVDSSTLITPSSGRQILFVDGSDKKLKLKDENGVINPISQLNRNDMIRLAATKLRLTVLEVNAGIDGVDDDQADLFTTPTGIKNTVLANSSTSIFNNSQKIYFNNPIFNDSDGNTIIQDNNNYYTTSTSYVLVKSYDLSIWKYAHSIDVRFGNSTYPSDAWCYVKFIFEDDTSETSSVHHVSSNTSTTFKYNIVNWNTKKVKRVEVYLKHSGDGDSYVNLVKLYETPINIGGTPSNRDIVNNYTKSFNPSSVYLAVFDSQNDMTTDEIGDVTFELTDGTNTTGELTPFEIHNISLPNTPTKIIIHQKDTTVSKIAKYVLFINP